MISTINFHWIVIGWIVIAVFAFMLLLKVSAPYGRHIAKGWGKMISNRLGWIIMELPALITCPVIFYLGNGEKYFLSYIFIGLWVVHYFNRVFIFPLRIRTKGKKMPLLIVFSAIFFNFVNGFICGYYLGFLSIDYSLWHSTPQFWLGIVLFITGMVINWQSDTILIHLRKPNETGYKIPKGRMFNYISCPNHFGEIIEWLGFAIMTWSLPTFSFAIWTFANLAPRAYKHHQWYQSTFEDYPKERKALLPFIW